MPVIYAFLDGARGREDAGRVSEVRALVREIDWCEVVVTERAENLGLGRNVREGVGYVAARHEAFIVWEDDLICVPGTYAWMCAALRAYAADAQVMSVSAWTHPSVTPAAVGDRPYFDGRAECWVWGAYARSWAGMERSALEKMRAVAAAGGEVDAYGADLPPMARVETRKNLWAVRWLYHHFQHGGLCLRPPWSMVEHIGFDASATHSEDANRWANPRLRASPPVPGEWPDAVEQVDCRRLWRAANPLEGAVMRGVRACGRVRRRARSLARARILSMLPAGFRQRLRVVAGWKWFRGDYPSWAAARAASGGYDDAEVLRTVLEATLLVQSGQAAFERDGVLFYADDPDVPLVSALQEIERPSDGCLRVLDFGGSLGSSFWRHRALLPQGEKLRWDVVEQPAFAEAGRRYLFEPGLRFHDDVRSAQNASGHDVLLCSTALQYMESPFAHLQEWGRLEIPYLLLNNLPLHAKAPDRIRVQHVPPSIYAASYPIWFFNRDDFLRRVGECYEVVKEFESEAVWPVGWGMFKSTGLLLKRKGTA